MMRERYETGGWLEDCSDASVPSQDRRWLARVLRCALIQQVPIPRPSTPGLQAVGAELRAWLRCRPRNLARDRSLRISGRLASSGCVAHPRVGLGRYRVAEPPTRQASVVSLPCSPPLRHNSCQYRAAHSNKLPMNRQLPCHIPIVNSACPPYVSAQTTSPYAEAHTVSRSVLTRRVRLTIVAGSTKLSRWGKHLTRGQVDG